MKYLGPPSSTQKVPKVCWLPDETLFSLCSRQHVLSGNIAPCATSAQLFGLSHKSIKHDLPCGLDAFEKHSQGCWGSADSILAQHTIFPLFAPFQSAEAIRSAISTLKGNNVGSLKYRLGLVTGGFGAEHPLKGCVQCLESDLRLSGAPYWRLSHQYPGVLLCPIHGTLLLECTQNRRWHSRFTWTVPSKDAFANAVLEAPQAPQYVKLLSLAKAILDLASVGLSTTFDPLTVSLTYRRHLDTVDSFLEHVEPLRYFHPFEGLPGCEKDAKRFIYQMTRTPRRYYHPLKHLLIITWIFGDFDVFSECYSTIASSVQSPDSLLETMVSISFGAAEPARPAIVNTRRPKRLKPHLRKQLTERLSDGIAKQMVCTEFGLTISTVNKILRSEPVVLAAWKQAQQHQQLSIQRGKWCELRSTFPKKSVKELRSCSPSTYAWLYRNDKNWLCAQTKEMPKAVRSRISPDLEWNARDERLERLVRERLAAAYGTYQSILLTKSQLFSLVPSLASSLENRSHYPCTRAYVKSIIQRPSRRIKI
ncbi:TnsD family Tn7-like transposition protein [Pseudomonas sp. Leaf127]|uniref:TnsD family Tn7-like transposition protein n=1 Tax=Pseudomonas sp. Leaf127 TaxID=1736267 RepID=UPI0009EC9997